MRKLIAFSVAAAVLAFAPPAFAIAITNPANGDCHEAVTPATFNGSSSAFPDNPGGQLGPWNGVFNSSSAAISGVFC